MGPLAGVRIVEFAGLGPGPMAAMLLADLGATVLRIERAGSASAQPSPLRKFDVVLRNRSAISLDLKRPADVQTAMSLVASADALIEGFRPGVMERLGLGPDTCFECNAPLVYCRMTGWGQEGPLSQAAGHDINYIALSGALDAIGRAGQAPTPPLNLVGDYGGGALYLALGLVSAVLAARASGRGQVVDVAMIDGATSLMSKFFGNHAAGLAVQKPVGERGTNLLDSGAYFYDVYPCADDRFMSVGAIEPQFHAALLERMEIDPASLPPQWDRTGWPRAKDILARRFREKTQAEWCARFEGFDACAMPVLRIDEVHSHAHVQARQTVIDIDGVAQPAPAPRFSRTVLDRPTGPRAVDADRAAVLRAWGVE